LGFAHFEPDNDPADPEPVAKRALSHPTDKITEEVLIRAEAIDSTSPGALPTTLVSPTASTPSTNTDLPAKEDSASRPFLTFVLVTLLAALGGALYLAFQQTNLPDLPSGPEPARTAGPPSGEQVPGKASDPSPIQAPR